VGPGRVAAALRDSWVARERCHIGGSVPGVLSGPPQLTRKRGRAPRNASEGNGLRSNNLTRAPVVSFFAGSFRSRPSASPIARDRALSHSVAPPGQAAVPGARRGEAAACLLRLDASAHQLAAALGQPGGRCAPSDSQQPRPLLLSSREGASPAPSGAGDRVVANAIARSIVVETSKAIVDEMHAFRAIRVACRWYQMHVSP